MTITRIYKRHHRSTIILQCIKSSNPIISNHPKPTTRQAQTYWPRYPLFTLTNRILELKRRKRKWKQTSIYKCWYEITYELHQNGKLFYATLNRHPRYGIRYIYLYIKQTRAYHKSQQFNYNKVISQQPL